MTDLDLRDAGPLPAEGASILAGLSVQIGRLADQISADRDERRARQHVANLPVARVETGVAVGQAQNVIGTLVSGQVVLDLGGPQVGRNWRIVSLAVSDAGNVQTAMGGKADWYIGKATPPVQPIANWVPLAPTAWRWTFPNLPNLVLVSIDARTIKPNDRLYCVVTGGTASQSVLAQAEIQDFDPLATSAIEAM